MRFDELLGEFAAITVPADSSGRSEAWRRLLHQMAQRVAFEPASDDVPVTVTAGLDDPIVRYDGIWVAGLSAETWPPAAQPDPLMPLTAATRLVYLTRAPTANCGWRSACNSWQRRAQHCV